MQHQLVCSQHVHHPLAVLGLHQVLDVERRQAEELVGTLVLQLQQSTLDGSHGSRRDVAVLGGVLLGMFRHPVEHGAQILDVVNEHATFVGYAEHDVQHTVLCLVQLHQS